VTTRTGRRTTNRTLAAAIVGAATLALAAVAPAGGAYHEPETEQPVVNPCLDPAQTRLRCPDLRMAPPSNLRLDGSRTGKLLLRAKNDIRSRGTGPIELRGQRIAAKTMKVRQRIHRTTGGSPKVVPIGGRLYFYNVPGQGPFWKFKDAARFELWTVKPDGTLNQLARTGPKVYYCFRDLEHTRPSWPGSPRHRVYPGCSQRKNRRAVTLGTSVGWSDVYPADYDRQWINVTDLRGCFAYVHIADPKNHILESNEENNRSRVLVRLPAGRRVGHC
jgi:lysyl oxidase